MVGPEGEFDRTDLKMAALIHPVFADRGDPTHRGSGITQAADSSHRPDLNQYLPSRIVSPTFYADVPTASRM